MAQDPNASSELVRIDAWLWAARFFKTRSLAKQAVEGGKVELNDASCKPAKPVRPGDVLKITRGEERFVLHVLALSAKSGPATVAQALYRETEPSMQAREALREQRRLMGADMGHAAGRPSKQDRRALRRFKDFASEPPE